MTLRDATEADLPAIVEIHNAAIASRISTAQLDPVRVEERHDWFRAHSPHRYPLWVAQIDNAIAGWLSFREFLPRQAYRGTARTKRLRAGKLPAPRDWKKTLAGSDCAGAPAQSAYPRGTYFRPEPAEY